MIQLGTGILGGGAPPGFTFLIGESQPRPSFENGILGWGYIYWLVLSDEQMSKKWQFSLLNDEQMSNWVGVKHLPVYHDWVENDAMASETIVVKVSMFHLSSFVIVFIN